MKTLRALTLALAAAGWMTLAQAQGVRPEVGKPLQQAVDLLKAGKAKDALVKVREAEAVPGITPSERQTIDGMKASAAQRAGDMPTAIQALESLASRASGAQLGAYAEQLASAYAQQKNNAKATEWLNKAIAAGNTGPSVKQLQTYLQAASGDYAAVVKDGKLGLAGIVLALLSLPLFDYRADGELAGYGLWFVLALAVLAAWGVQAYFIKLANVTMDAASIFFYMNSV